jgi:hypothetical protein
MSSTDGATPDELRVLVKATGGEIENLTDKLADEVALVDQACAAKIRAIGAEAAEALREAASDLGSSAPH